VIADELVVGFGGNVGDDAAIVARFRAAREALAGLGAVRAAPLYRSAAVAPGELAHQPAFLNTAVAVRGAAVEPDEVLAAVLAIERAHGRDRAREERWGPRTLDLDLLVWGERRVHAPALELPHPRLAERRFALRPLADLVGEDAVLPGASASLRDLLARVAAQPLELLGAW
jgi:2-amino-4-hydroxy-6-hydroxymethyldihydropteridine diphosphokinase